MSGATPSLSPWSSLPFFLPSCRSCAVRRASLMGMSLCLAGAVLADDSQAERLASLPLEQLLQFQVDSVSRYAQQVASAPASVSIVTAQDIRSYGYRTLADVLQSMRGLYLSYDRNYAALGVRGFATPGDYNTRVLLLVDGMRLADPVYDQ